MDEKPKDHVNPEGPATANADVNAPPALNEAPSLDKIQQLLKSKDDTSRLVGLALLKSVLDNSPAVRQDEATIVTLWESISPRFLDRLMRSGQKGAKDLLDMAVSIIRTFAALLPEEARRNSRLLERIHPLVGAILNSSQTTTKLTLQTLQGLVNSPQGAAEFLKVKDITPLTENAPSNRECLEVLSLAWHNAMADAELQSSLPKVTDSTISSLVVSFKGTDAVTLLAFLGSVVGDAGREVLPANPRWLRDVVVFIRNLVGSRPSNESRHAYTTAAAAFLQAYPAQMPSLLFVDPPGAEKPFSYLFINLLLIDIRSSLPSLLGKLNSPDYAKTARRLASAYDILASYIGFLVGLIDEDGQPPLPSDLLLKLRKQIGETLSVTIEFLRDRWDGAVAGAMGLHPDAIPGKAETNMGSRLTLTWESATNRVHEDPLILSALRPLALWVRDDDNDMLKEELVGLYDMLMDLYRSSAPGKLDFRSAVLVAVEGLTNVDVGNETLLNEGGWSTLVTDLASILRLTSTVSDEDEALRGIEIAKVLQNLVQWESGATREEWMALATAVAAWDCPQGEQPVIVRDFQLSVVTLVRDLLTNASAGMQKRYVHTLRAVVGICAQLMPHVTSVPLGPESLKEAYETLHALTSEL